VRITDPLNNIQEGLIDYRVLQPFLTRDINGNHSEAAFDTLGMLVGSAIMGKAGRAPDTTMLGIDQPGIDQMRANTEADSLHGFVSDLTNTTQAKLLEDPDGAGNAPYSANNARNALKRATSRIVYELDAYQLNGEANRTCSIAREQHHKDNASSPLQVSYEFSDGFGRSVQQKAQAEPVRSGTNKNKRRWVVSGWSVLNNKGSVVKEFEPRFSFLTKYEPDVETGVSTVTFYDPLQRAICTLNPNHSYEKVIFNPWQQSSWDSNDTVLSDPRTDTDVKDYVSLYIGSLPSFETWHKQHSNATTPANQQAASKAAAHDKTPSIDHLGSNGEIFLTQVNNKTETLDTRLATDIQGNDLSITDPRGITLFTHDFDMASQKLFIDSKDAGEKRLFPAVDENPVLSWDANNNQIHTIYDKLRRPSEIELEKPGQSKKLVDKFIYGESRAQPESRNARGELWKHFDSAGLATIDNQDFKGNVVSTSRRLLTNAKESETAWPKAANGDFDENAAGALLEPNTRLNTNSYTVNTSFDALNRLTENTLPNGATQTPEYNQASLLERVSMRQSANGTDEVYVQNIDYNAKGQREKIVYGNGVTTNYEYETDTFRLKSIFSSRTASPKTLQKLTYTYDPVGNITTIRDDAHKIIFNKSQKIEPESSYTYDAIYRLIEATGREHESMTACHYQTSGKKHTEFLPLHQSTANAQALINYIETYQYDKSGNITQTKHDSKLGTIRRTRIRNQTYSTRNNRILKSNAGCANEDKTLSHDANGNLTKLAHLQAMKWDFKNQLVEVQLNKGPKPNKAFYQYDSSGQRIRKLVVRNSGTITSERIYLGDYEIYTEPTAGNPKKQRETIHISDNQARVALVETEIDTHNPANPPTILKRFQLSNHLASSTQELNETGQRISCEEYYPYGGTAYLAGKNQTEVSKKRYRYSGKERDDETGFYYFGARYYAPWIGRWISSDDIYRTDDISLYIFVKNTPIRRVDENGNQSKESDPSNTESSTPTSSALSKLKSGAAVFTAYIRVNTSLANPATLGTNLSDAKKVIELVRIGKSDEALKTATGYKKEIDILEKSETIIGGLSIVAADKVGLIDIAEAATNADLNGKSLSKTERVLKGITGGTQLALTVIGARFSLSKKSNSKLPGINSSKLPPGDSTGSIYSQASKTLGKLRQKRIKEFDSSRAKSAEDRGIDITKKATQDAELIKLGKYPGIDGLSKLSFADRLKLANTHLNTTQKQVSKVVNNPNRLELIRPKNPVVEKPKGEYSHNRTQRNENRDISGKKIIKWR